MKNKYDEAFTNQLNQKRETSMKIPSIILTTLLMGAGGFIAGTLLAPRKGSKTRKKLVNKGHEYTDYLVDNINEIADTVSHPFENLEDQTIRLSEKAINKAKKMKAEALQKVNNENENH